MAHEYDNKEHCATTTGGNSTVVNGNEQEPLNRVVMVPSRTVQGMQDGDFH